MRLKRSIKLVYCIEDGVEFSTTSSEEAEGCILTIQTKDTEGVEVSLEFEHVDCEELIGALCQWHDVVTKRHERERRSSK